MATATDTRRPKYTLKKYQRGSTLKLLFSVIRDKSDLFAIPTETIHVYNIAKIILTFKGYKQSTGTNDSNDLHIRMKMMKTGPNACSLPIKVDLEDFQGYFIPSDHWIDSSIKVKHPDCVIATPYSSGCRNSGGSVLLYTFEMSCTVQPQPSTPIFSVETIELYKDEESTDFELQGTDGCVSFHSKILLGLTDVFKGMLRSGLTEAKENRMKMMESVETLRHLKDYAYLGKLPKTGVEPLLLIASCYMMNKMKADCIEELVKTAKPSDIKGLVKLACDNNMPELVHALLFCTSDETLSVACQLFIDEKKPDNK